ncbi:hypothetical protein B0H10DRAFT_1939097 [Mycena sp. CBHHK59/15]|nr:hypothetical protein B0H10DRAFT_1939097 [Mycena sp. CBHHK59/15]
MPRLAKQAAQASRGPSGMFVPHHMLPDSAESTSKDEEYMEQWEQQPKPITHEERAIQAQGSVSQSGGTQQTLSAMFAKSTAKKCPRAVSVSSDVKVIVPLLKILSHPLGISPSGSSESAPGPAMHEAEEESLADESELLDDVEIPPELLISCFFLSARNFISPPSKFGTIIQKM